MSDDITKNKAWCPIPWVTYSVNSLGQYRLCVQANSYKPPNDRWQRKGSMGMLPEERCGKVIIQQRKIINH